MLVSYDMSIYLSIYQLNCRVTRMLVSYDRSFDVSRPSALIAGSPECWWVTTVYYEFAAILSVLQGHQNVGELRHKSWCSQSADVDCRVTRMLVSYDTLYSTMSCAVKLQGHQNVGELRHLNCCSVSYCNCFAFKM